MSPASLCRTPDESNYHQEDLVVVGFITLRHRRSLEQHEMSTVNMDGVYDIVHQLWTLGEERRRQTTSARIKGP